MTEPLITILQVGMVPVILTPDGVFITTRVAWFEVAEACAGVKFLVAMLAYGLPAPSLQPPAPSPPP